MYALYPNNIFVLSVWLSHDVFEEGFPILKDI